jgi:hypothetical protein
MMKPMSRIGIVGLGGNGSAENQRGPHEAFIGLSEGVQGIPGKRVFSRAIVEQAVERGKDWLLRNQITRETAGYDVLEFLNPDKKKNRWRQVPTPPHLVGAFYANLIRNDPYVTRSDEVRQQYHNTWHTAQAGVALLEYLDYRDDPAVRRAVDLAWEFIDRQQVKAGAWKGVFVEVPVADLKPPLQHYYTFGHLDARARSGYASYDNIETDLFPLELYARRRDEKYLRCAADNARFYLEQHPELVMFEADSGKMAISGMSNDAIYGRLAALTGDERMREAFSGQIRRLNQLGLDLRAGNNIRNIYWDATACMYAVEQGPELKGPAMAKLAFLAEHLLAAQKESGVLWFRFLEPGVPDATHARTQDGAATYAAMRVWGTMYNLTGDPRWLAAIRSAAAFALTQQYPDSHGPEFAGAFEYAGTMIEPNGHRWESLRDISTIFALRALLPLLRQDTRWARDFWS